MFQAKERYVVSIQLLCRGMMSLTPNRFQKFIIIIREIISHPMLSNKELLDKAVINN